MSTTCVQKSGVIHSRSPTGRGCPSQPANSTATLRPRHFARLGSASECRVRHRDPDPEPPAARRAVSSVWRLGVGRTHRTDRHAPTGAGGRRAVDQFGAIQPHPGGVPGSARPGSAGAVHLLRHAGTRPAGGLSGGAQLPAPRISADAGTGLVVCRNRHARAGLCCGLRGRPGRGGGTDRTWPASDWCSGPHGRHAGSHCGRGPRRLRGGAPLRATPAGRCGGVPARPPRIPAACTRAGWWLARGQPGLCARRRKGGRRRPHWGAAAHAVQQRAVPVRHAGGCADLWRRLHGHPLR